MDITFMTPINSMGYGVTGINILRSLVRAKHDVTLIPIGKMILEPEWGELVGSRTMMAGRDYYNPDAPMVRNFHEWRMEFPPGKGKKISWPFFEVDGLSNIATQQLNNVDAVAAGSVWIEQVLRENGVEVPIFRAPQGVDTLLFRPMPANRMDDHYRFFTIGKYELRKGHPEVISAFKMAFPDDRNVRLYMMCDNPFMSPGSVDSEIEHLAKRDPRITVIKREATHSGVAAFINRCDCGVFPSRGEGWGLPMLECLSCSKPLIATFVTSQKDYLNKQIATEVQTKGLTTATDGVFFNGIGRWYQPDIRSLAEAMRDAYDSDWRSNPEGRLKALEFTWDIAADKLVKGIEGL